MPLWTPGLLTPGALGIVAASSFATWNPSDKHADITLSNGDLTATQAATDAHRGVRATASAASGIKFYQTIPQNDPGTVPLVGISNAAMALTAFLGSTANGVGWDNTGAVRLNNSTIETIDGWSNGSVLSLWFDLDTGEFWGRVDSGNWNGSATADPTTNTEGIDISGLAAGPYFPAMSLFTNGDSFTANFGATAYSPAPPSGSTNW
jgi:hypothetical protein